MRIKISILGLFLLGFSMNIQAQSIVSEKKATLTPATKTVKVEVPTATKNSSQQTKDNIRRRNMAKYKAMSSRRATKKEENKKGPKRKK